MKTATTTALANLPRVNLLPPEIGQRHKVQQVQIGAVVAALAVAAGMGLLYMHGKSTVNDQKAKLAAAQGQQVALQAKLNQLRYVTQTATVLSSAEATLTQATATEVHWSDFLADISVVTPPTVWLSQLTFSESIAPGTLPTATAAGPVIGSISMAGTALAQSSTQSPHSGIALWLDAAAKEKGFSSAWFSNAQEAYIGDVKVSNFSSNVNLTSDALTKRCVQPGVC